MTDLLTILPNFPISSYSKIIPIFERNGITVSDLLCLEPLDILRRAQMPFLDLKRLQAQIINELQIANGMQVRVLNTSDLIQRDLEGTESEKTRIAVAIQAWSSISILDGNLDNALGGGIATGCVTEITGESGAGKTQFLLSLSMAVQLSKPHGLSKNALYISTEAPLATSRLAQMLKSNPLLSQGIKLKPSLANIHSVNCQDLEAQEHILEYQVPIAIDRYNIGLVVLDSVAANFRAEHGSNAPKELADRAAQLIKLGEMLRNIARTKNVAVVVANQVSDRFETIPGRDLIELRTSSPAFSSSPTAPPALMQPPLEPSQRDLAMTLDNQQRFFTGWGDTKGTSYEGLKTPALGLTWTNQISARIALRMEDVRADGSAAEGELGGNIWHDRKKRRFLKVVFAPWAKPGKLVEYEITSGGVKALPAAKDQVSGMA